MSDIVERLRYLRGNSTHSAFMIYSQAADEITRLRTALSEAEQRAKDGEGNLNEEISHRQKLQAALMFWMPSVTEEIERSTNGRCGDDACLLAGYDGPIDESCWGDDILARVQRARREALEEADAIVAKALSEGSDIPPKAVKHIVGIRSAIRALIPSEPHDAEGRE